MKRKINLTHPTAADGKTAVGLLKKVRKEVRFNDERDALQLAITALEAWTIDQETNEREET